MNYKKYLLTIYFLVSFSCAQVIMTEIMYDLVGTDSPNEFVELFNLSQTDTADLSGYSIMDKSSEDALVDSGFGISIPPQSYAIIFEGDYSLTNGIYADSIPSNTILIKVDDSSIGNGLSTADSLYLMDSSGIVIDSLGWTDVAPDGFSLEKVRLTFSNAPENWDVSKDSLGTPGKANSVLPFTVDGKLLSDSLTLTPNIVSSSELISLKGKVINNGTQTISGEIIISTDREDLENIDVSNLAELDTVSFETDLGPFSSGNHSITAHFQVSNDEDTTNNLGTVSAGVRYSEGTLTINEFMPAPSSGMAEFVEFIYHGTDSLNLENWRIADATESGNYIFPDLTLNSSEYFVAAEDSSIISFIPDSVLFIVPNSGFPNLNNTTPDQVRIFDPFGTLIDSIRYDSDWGYSSGVSAEKIFPDSSSDNSSNWKTTEHINGMTPGFVNSVTPRNIDGALLEDQISYSPLPPTSTDSINFSIPVLNSGLQNISGTVSITKDDSQIGGGSFSSLAKFDTTIVTVSIEPMNSGKSVVTIELIVSNDLDSTDNLMVDTINVSYPFGTIQINEFMAMPNNNQTEFVEIVAFDSISLYGWGISDNTLNIQFLPAIEIISGEYVVIAADSNIASYAPTGATVVVPTTGFSTLNNSGDAIFIFDATGTVVDSLIYSSAWGIESEISSEKIRPEFESSVIDNWALSTEIGGMTPGYGNSVTLFDTDGGLVQDSNFLYPVYPTANETSILFIKIMNAGVQAIGGSVSVEENDEEIGSQSISSIAFRDTSQIEVSIPELQSGEHPIVITLSISGDENSTNNIGFDTLLISYPFETVFINEFLSQPETTQTEFIELFNANNISLEGWSISDNTNSKKTLSFSGDNGKRAEYIIIADNDSLLMNLYPVGTISSVPDGFPALNNTSDAIFLYDMTGFIIDSLIYSEDWPLFESRSTEKLRPEFSSNDSSRWAIAVNDTGMTPGKQNSVYFEELANAGNIIFEPNPFSPNGDGHDDILYLKYKLPFETAVIKIEIFDVVGRSIATPYWNVYSAQESILKWDGTKNNGQTARIGIYIVKTTARDGSSGQLWEDVQTVVLAKPL
ncbi:MAG: lamin tail domain-containing protein [Candidatus Marinimicrobia bacterium]|nr:lamin tail domain-containing protein [Candidatus Neomarinimicrobiota bacterium]MBT3617432.1 lamin tail domain-containing protein [Candidatus Neomarinimicrobiota bacterium]MBT3829372.1 lamin tail domain-containing protein [Candidatus Neomarinimicrobiota bacterium]MBT4280953.1 lamin tail domain-containing protein [Candidatus Neomarinimicrobiota bacterium]MBT4796399.1 lamin tail domain-containing protein [Candidatus Neomarinimicrobiota bacterium]